MSYMYLMEAILIKGATCSLSKPDHVQVVDVRTLLVDRIIINMVYLEHVTSHIKHLIW